VSLVVDASVALKWFLSEELHASQALAVVQGGATLIAPDFLIAGVCNGGVAFGKARPDQPSPACCGLSLRRSAMYG
jgi:hypothetical protein